MKDDRLGLSTELLRQIISVIVKHVKPQKIIIYGSRARGDYKATSDVDIALECGQDSYIPRTEIDDAVRTLLKLDIVDLRIVAERLRKEIEREGVVVYESV